MKGIENIHIGGAGYYWVKYITGKDWEIAYYDGGYSNDDRDWLCWQTIGWDEYSRTSDIEEIGEKIPSNDELKSKIK